MMNNSHFQLETASICSQLIINNSPVFSYFLSQSVKLEGVTPMIGPVSGGTQLAITGQHLNIGSHVSAYLDELPCLVNITQASSTRITCITSRSHAPRPINVLTVSIDGANRTLASRPFIFKADPTILEIKPLMSFISGGRMITVHGTNLDTIQKPEMVVFVESINNPINKTVRYLHFNSNYSNFRQCFLFSYCFT